MHLNFDDLYRLFFTFVEWSGSVYQLVYTPLRDLIPPISDETPLIEQMWSIFLGLLATVNPDITLFQLMFGVGFTLVVVITLVRWIDFWDL